MKKHIPIVCILILQLVCSLLRFNGGFTANGDDVYYWSLGTSLSSKNGFKAEHIVGNPKETKYPVGFPAIISVVKSFGGGIVSVKTVVLLLSLTTTYLLWLYAGTGIAFIHGSAALTHEYGSVLLSEAPFLFFVVLGLYALSSWPSWVAALLCFVPLLFRSAGIALPVTAIISLLALREYKIVIASTIVLCVAILVACNHGDGGYLSQLLSVSAYDPMAGSVGFSGIVDRINDNAVTYAKLWSNALAPGFPIAFIPCVFILVSIPFLRLSPNPLTVYLLLSWGIVLVWPQYWSSERFLFPLVTLTMIPVVVAISHYKRASGLLLIIAICAANLVWSLRTAHKPWPDADGWNQYNQCCYWMASNTPTDAVVVSRKPEHTWLWSGRRGQIYPMIADPDRQIAYLDSVGATHILIDRFNWTRTTGKYLVPAVLKYKDRFRIIYQSGWRGALVAEYRHE